MLAQFLQCMFSGITVGSMYSLAALGYALIFNASGIINFAQGEFVMLGAMLAAVLVLVGFSLPLAFLVAVLVAVLAGLATERFVIQPAENYPIMTLLIITLGVGSVIRGLCRFSWVRTTTCCRRFLVRTRFRLPAQPFHLRLYG